MSELMCEVSFSCLFAPNTFKCKLESLLTLDNSKLLRELVNVILVISNS